MKHLVIITVLFFSRVYGQEGSLEFYGDRIQLPAISIAETDSLIRGETVPAGLRQYMDSTLSAYNLDDWGVVLFLQKLVGAAFGGMTEADRVRILSSLLAGAGINNAIGVRSKNQLLSLVSIDKRVRYVNGQGSFEEDGYKFIPVEQDKRPFRFLKRLEIRCKADYKDIRLDYSRTPRLTSPDVVSKTVAYFDHATGKTDSLTFRYSPVYTRYSNDLPRIAPNGNYYKAPASPIFAFTLFEALGSRIGRCASRIDSINFLVKFVQTAVKFEEDVVVYGKEDFCSFPENTLAVGKGDCEDKCELFAFLVNHYFRGIDIIFLYYSNHVRIGLYDPMSVIGNKAIQEFDKRKYVIAELQDSTTVLGDDFFNIFHQDPMEIVR